MSLDHLPYDPYDDFISQGDEPTTVEFEEVIGETEKAWLLGMPDGEEIWFPKSQCKLRRRSRSLTLPVWLASAKGVR